MDREVFFASVRPRVSGLFNGSISQPQVDGINAMLDEAERRGTPINHLAYVLATAKHETASTMQPVRETLASTDDRAILILENSWKAGKLPWVKTPYWRKDADGKSWLGRGLVQITHKANYSKFGLTANPSKAMEMPTAIRVIFDGMEQGSFTGKKLSDYITDSKADYFGARRIVNGTDRAADIAVIAKSFEAALKAAEYDPSAKPAPPPANPAPATPEAATGGWLSAIIKIIAAIFGARK